MPRATIVLKDFSGGLCNYPDAKDIAINEFAVIDGASLSKMGTITMVGTADPAVADRDWDARIDNARIFSPGYGIFPFGSDYSTGGTFTPTQYIAMAGKTTDATAANRDKMAEVFLHEGDGVITDGVAYATIHGNTSLPFYPVFYYVAGGLRICDGNLGDTHSSNQIYQFINNTHFLDATLNKTTYHAWFINTNTLDAPACGMVSRGLAGVGTAGGDTNDLFFCTYLFDSLKGTPVSTSWAVNSTAGRAVDIVTSATSDTCVTSALATGTWASAGYKIYPALSGSFHINLSTATTAVGGLITTGAYKVAYCFVYDGNQESKLYLMNGGIDLSTHTGPCRLTLKLLTRVGFSERITGAKFYMKQAEDLGAAKDPLLSVQRILPGQAWYKIFEVNMEKGVVLDKINSVYSPFISESALINNEGGAEYQNFVYTDDFYVTTMGPETYESDTGFINLTGSINARYGTAVLANNRVYIGNVRINNKIFGDSVFKSPYGKYDVFTEENRLDIATNDGDNVIKLESFADRLFIFKKNKSYVVSIGQDVEYLEAELDYMGIDAPYQAVRTEFGLAWFNKKGCYLYDGQRVRDLFLDSRDPSRRKIDLTAWETFTLTYPSIGYDATEKQLIIMQDSLIQTGKSKDMMIFDMRMENWVYSRHQLGSTFSTAAGNMSNIATGDDGYAIFAFDDPHCEFYRWLPAPHYTTYLYIKTKDIDFDLPGIKKSVYAIYVTHKGSTGNVAIQYMTNGDTAVYQLAPSTGGTSGILKITTSWICQKFTPITTATRNINSIQLIIRNKSSATNTVYYGFQISDIDIIYRQKGIR